MSVAMLTYSEEDGAHSYALETDAVSIGRSPSQDLVLHDSMVSRRHALVIREGDDYAIEDQNSTHGTFLNGKRIQRAIVKDGDVVHLGSLHGVKLQFRTRKDQETNGHVDTLSLDGLIPGLYPQDATAGEPSFAKRGIEQLDWFLRAARQVNESGKIEDILLALLRLTLQLTGAERGFVFLGKGGALHFAAGLNGEGAQIPEDDTISRRAMQKAIESRSKFTVGDTLSDERASGWSSVLANRIRSIYCIPLRKRVGSPSDENGLLGLLYLDSQIMPGSLTTIDHQLLDTIATEAAALIENVVLAEAEFKARQAREELAIAAQIHSGLMAFGLPTLPYALLEAKSIPCLEIGGDFYDAVLLDDCVCVAVVDVSGKGVSAAIVAATLQGIIHAQLLTRHSLSDIAAQVNQFLCARDVGKYATMVIARIFPNGRLQYINCGHVHPVAVLGSRVRRLDESNLIVGLIPGAQYQSTFDCLERGERLVLATDGVTEAEDPGGKPFGMEGLTAAAQNPTVDAMLKSVQTFQASAQGSDDCTLLTVEYCG